MFIRNSFGSAHESFTKDSGNFPEVYGNFPEACESLRKASGTKPKASGAKPYAFGTKPSASGDRKEVKAAEGPRLLSNQHGLDLLFKLDISTEELRMLFRVLDRNHDGVVDAAEFCEMMRKLESDITMKDFSHAITIYSKFGFDLRLSHT